MSWKENEWKENLPNDALCHITTMESSLEKLQKDISEWQFKTESLSHTASTLTEKLHEKDKEIQVKDREIIDLKCKIEEGAVDIEDLNLKLRKKDDEIHGLIIKVESSRRKSRIKKQSSELEENTVSENKNAQTNENGENIEDVDAESEYEDDDEDMDEEDSSDEEEKSRQYRETVEHLELLLKEKNQNIVLFKSNISTLVKDNENFERDEKELKEKIGYLEQRIETLLAEKVVLENKACSLEEECISQNKNNEGANGEDNHKNKVSQSKQIGIGSYLGIDFRSYSDTTLAAGCSYPNSNLIEENTRLRRELEKLRDIPNSSSSSERVVHVLPDESNLDSGVDLPSTVSQIKSQLTKEIELQKKEVTKLRGENLEMKQIYENHIKICGSQKGDSVVENMMRTKSESYGNLQTNVKSGFHHLEKIYSSLDEKISEMSSVSRNNLSSLSSKLDHIVNGASGGNVSLSIDLATEIEQLKSDILRNFFTVQDEMHKGHEELRKKIASTTAEICSNIISNERNSKTTFSDEKRGHFFQTNVSDNSIGELETIKEKIGGIQHAINESVNEKRRAEIQIQKLEDELKKLMETLRRKEKEIGRLTQLHADEKRKVAENDAQFRNEMVELQKEQLEICEEFRNMCDKLKRNDIELANRNKQLKILTAEKRAKEDELNDEIIVLRTKKEELESDQRELNRQYKERSAECRILLKKIAHAEDEIRGVYNNVAKIDGIVQKAKSDGLYE